MRIYSIKLALTPYPLFLMIIEKPLYFELFCSHVYRLVVSSLAPVKRQKFATKKRNLKLGLPLISPTIKIFTLYQYTADLPYFFDKSVWTENVGAIWSFSFKPLLLELEAF